MLTHLFKPGLHHYFVGPLQWRAPQARLYRKSGTWGRWAADSVLVWGPRRRYILVALTAAGAVGGRILPGLVGLAEKTLGQGIPLPG
jgi:beta-lactamase class A